jgi:hypothetical protein
LGDGKIMLSKLPSFVTFLLPMFYT